MLDRLTTAIIIVLALACSVAGFAVGRELRRTAASKEIVNEVPGAAEFTFRHYWDPDVTLTGYAMPVIITNDDCSATMIGPNLLLSAAHCGPSDSATAKFLTYATPTPTGLSQEDFKCHFLLQTFADTDLTVYFCEPNAAGVSPGDKYGYLDFDSSPVAVNDRLYSVWWNPIAELAGNNGILYSEGSITSVTGNGWFVPGTQQIAIFTNLYGAPGVSGSSQLRLSNHRIAVGPTSVADAPEGAFRGALSIRDYLQKASVDGTNPTGLNPARLAALGLTGGNYVGGLDKNGDFLIDVQQDLERLRGENARGWYYLGFESERRNALWDVAGATFNPQAGTAHIDNASGNTIALRHSRLNLPAATYRVTVTTTAPSAQAGALQFALFANGLAQDSATLGVQAGTQVQSFRLSSTVPGAELRIVAVDNMAVDLSAIDLIAEGTVMDFDAHDQRLGWRGTGGTMRGTILPEGRSAAPNAPSADWAGDAIAIAVGSQGTFLLGDLWTLQNRQFALVHGRTYQICFEARQRGTTPLPAGGTAALRVVSGGSEALRFNFQTAPSWQRFCAPTFTASSDDDTLQFGGTMTQIVPTSNTAAPEYLVDNVTITDPCVASACGCANFASDPNNCGSCGNVCSMHTPMTCSQGLCVCADGLTQCGGLCVNTSLDGANCGGCRHRCARGQVCDNGVCSVPF
jgi:hypothetical protein